MSMDAVTNFAQLRGMPGGYVNAVAVGGSNSVGDGGGGTFFWDSSSTASDNGTTVIKADNNPTGRWIATDIFGSGGVLGVPGGGTGVNALTANNLLVGNGVNPLTFIAPGTNGQVLTSNGTVWAAATPSSGGDTTVMRTTDSAGSVNNTLADDTVLTFAVSANKNYRGRMIFWVLNAGTTATFKFQLTGPASPTSIFYTGSYIRTGSISAPNNAPATSFSSALSLTGLNTTTQACVFVEFTLLNGVNAGNVTVQWAQNTTDAGNATTMKAGSYIQYAQTN